MTPFRKIERNVATGMVERTALLAQPAETFSNFFEGRVPTLAEKVYFVETAVQRMTAVNIFENDTYHVELKLKPPFIHLDIRRLDGGPCNNWRNFQQIKNELVGPEFEAIELFPAESRLVDTGNEYHLWVYADQNYRFPVGFGERFVLTDAIRIQTNGDPSQGAPAVIAPQVVPVDGMARRQN